MFNYLLFDFASDRVEIATPLNSWRATEECIALRKAGIDPYIADSCHSPPLLVLALSNLLERTVDFLLPGIFIFCDLLTVYLLSCAVEKIMLFQLKNQDAIEHTVDKSMNNKLISIEHVFQASKLVTLCFLYNPFTLLNCVSRSTTVFLNLFLALALLMTSFGFTYFALMALALATYLEIYPCMLIVPVVIYSMIDKKSTVYDVFAAFLKNILIFATFCATLLWISWKISGSLNFLEGTYGFIISVPDLSPNVGLFWYFFTETFDHFRSFFLWIFILNPFVYVAPLAFKLRHNPPLLFYLLLMVIGIFKSYPCVGDSGFYLSLLPMWSHLLSYGRHSLVVACSLLASSFLAPVMWYMWIESGSANANFYFAITLVYSTCQIFLMTDVLHAYLKYQIYLQYGEKPKINGQNGTIVLQ